jgi:hypothetical protein
MKRTIILYSLLVVLAVAGAMFSFVAGISFERFNAETEPVSTFDYVFYVAGQLVLAASLAAGRWFIRCHLRYQSPSVSPINRNDAAKARILAAIGREANAHFAAGNTEDARILAQAADTIKTTTGGK